ncbi:organic solute transporter subunit alpha-like isoform X2 [Protopterus annectens]|uniref:organic solute transporter subunit alpha-like isoform X2 n=1 Tax=Protopterus annectens TaxID=7888 RepID=UPI001CFB8B4A|nr:organic solute transporter subunit alpha-like isoform X2 [Protopterus annectens]
MDKNVSQANSCERLDPPTAEQILAEEDPTRSTLYAVLTVMALAGILVYTEEVIYILRKIPPSYKRTTYIWITGAPTVIAATSCTGLWIPRSAMFTDFTAAIYFTICIHKFLVMMIEEYGGDASFISRLKDTPIKISTGPCCCCCLCLPEVKLSRRTLNILKFGTLQSALLRPVFLFFAIVLWSNGNYEQGKMDIKGAFFWITILTVITFIISLWPLGILFYQAKSNLHHQKIIPKFILNQL